MEVPQAMALSTVLHLILSVRPRPSHCAGGPREQSVSAAPLRRWLHLRSIQGGRYAHTLGESPLPSGSP
eukprot:4587585-Pyramimonas_sp.AAC.1